MNQENLSKDHERYSSDRRRKIAAGMMAGLAIAASGCGTGETKQAAELKEEQTLEEVVSDKQEVVTAQANVYPGSVLISDNVARRKQPVLNTPSAENPYDNRIEHGETKYTEYERPLILENEDGYWLGARPEDTNEFSDMEWTLLRQDTVEHMEFWSDPGLGPVRYNGTEGLTPNRELEVNVDYDNATLSTENGHKIAEASGIAEHNVFDVMAAKGYAPQETWTTTFPASWER